MGYELVPQAADLCVQNETYKKNQFLLILQKSDTHKAKDALTFKVKMG